MQLYQQRGLLINEQNIGEFVPLYKMRTTSSYNVHVCKLNIASITRYIFTSVTRYRVVIHSVHSLTTCVVYVLLS
jgi:hypothetical protein